MSAIAEPSGPRTEERAALVLGPGLRPIVLGGARSAPNVRGPSARPRPELIFSVHSPSEKLLGYAVVDRALPSSTWGGMTVADGLTLNDACRLARATTLQLDLFAIGRGSHHCLVSLDKRATARERASQKEEYLDAVRPLVENGLCTIVFENELAGSQPLVARKGLAASATAATLAALEHLQCDGTRATLALHRPTASAKEVVAALIEHGLRLLAARNGTLGAGADVVLLGAPLGSLGSREASAVRARAVVALEPTDVSLAVERKLHERGLLFVPDTIAAAGRLMALDLCARGLDERAAIERVFVTLSKRMRELLERSLVENKPLGAVVRESLGIGLVPGHANTGKDGT